MSELQRIHDLLPWYARGALDPVETGFVARWLEEQGADHPELLAELEWLRRTAGQLQAEAQASVSPAAGEAGLAQLMARIARDAPPAPSLASRLHDWLSGWFGLPAALAAAVIVQAVIIGVLALPAQTRLELLGATPTPGANAVLLTVAFRPGATESDIRATLARAQAQIAGGPSALGLYTLSVPAGRADASVAELRQAASVVESVQR